MGNDYAASSLGTPMFWLPIAGPHRSAEMQ